MYIRTCAGARSGVACGASCARSSACSVRPETWRPTGRPAGPALTGPPFRGVPAVRWGAACRSVGRVGLGPRAGEALGPRTRHEGWPCRWALRSRTGLCATRGAGLDGGKWARSRTIGRRWRTSARPCPGRVLRRLWWRGRWRCCGSRRWPLSWRSVRGPCEFGEELEGRCPGGLEWPPADWHPGAHRRHEGSCRARGCTPPRITSHPIAFGSGEWTCVVGELGGGTRVWSPWRSGATVRPAEEYLGA